MANEEDHIPHVYLLGKLLLANEQREFHIRNDPIADLAAGDEHGIVITQQGRAFAFGANSFGQLGLGHNKPIQRVACIKSLKFGETGEKVILSACGVGCSLVATNHGSLYGFGSNARCQLALPYSDRMEMFFEPKKIGGLPSKVSWKQIAMGSEHACALTKTGQVYTWGANDEGQCGFEKEFDHIPTPKLLELTFQVIAIACGNYHTALISQHGRLYVFGANESRQLGRSIPLSHSGPAEVSIPGRVKSVACGNQHTLVLTEDGKVFSTGLGSRGQLGLGSKIQVAETFEQIDSLPKNIVRIASGEGHSAAIDSRGYMYVFGDAKHGKLGLTSYANEFLARQVDQFKTMKVSNIVCGGCQTIVLAENRSPTDQDEASVEDEREMNGTLTNNPLAMSLARTKRHEFLNNRMNQTLQMTMRQSTPRDTIDRTVTMNNRHLRIETSSDTELDDTASNPDLTESMRSQLYNSRYGVIDGEFQTLDSNLHRDTLGKTSTRVKMLKTGALDQTAPLQAKDERKREPAPAPAPTAQRQDVHADDSEEETDESERSATPPRQSARVEQKPEPAPRALPKKVDREQLDSSSDQSDEEQVPARIRTQNPEFAPRALPKNVDRQRLDSPSEQSDEEQVPARTRTRTPEPASRALVRKVDRQRSGSRSEQSDEEQVPARTRTRTPAKSESDEEREPPMRKSRPKMAPSTRSSPSPSPPPRTNNTQRIVHPVTAQQDRTSNTTESSPRFFSRIFNSNPSTGNSKNPSDTTSRACSIM